jgi:hypothetical protein
MCRYLHDLPCVQLNFLKSNGSVSIKQNMSFNSQPSYTFVFLFLFSQKSSYYKLFILCRSIRIQHFMVSL